MIFDYILIGINLNSLMIAYYINKNNNNILLIDKKSIENHNIYYKNNTVLKSPMFSNNDVNFLNFLNDLNINFKDISVQIDNIKFNLLENFKIHELITIFMEFIKQFSNDNTSKNIKFIDKSSYFSDDTIIYIKVLCDFYDLDYNKITLFEFTNMINNCIINEFYIIDEKKLFNEIIIKYNNTNIKILYDEEFIKLEDKYIYTNNQMFEFNNKCLFFLSPKNINFINNTKYRLSTMYNYIWNTDINIEKKYLENIKYNYLKFNNKYVFNSKKKIELTDTLFFIDKNIKPIMYKKFEYINNIFNSNYIIIINNINIEKNIINNYFILNTIFKNNKIFKIYYNDSLIDIIKFLLFIFLFYKKM
jgi:hypothetical protein